MSHKKQKNKKGGAEKELTYDELKKYNVEDAIGDGWCFYNSINIIYGKNKI